MAYNGQARKDPGKRIPLCHFYFAHPFRVGDVCHGTLPLRTEPTRAPHRYHRHPAPLASRRSRPRQRRRGGRRYPGPGNLKSLVFFNRPGAEVAPKSPPTLEEVLWTIRDAWPPPRSHSLDSEKKERSNLMMGTGNRINGAAMPLMGLPYRRYSVPETVMRKYSLSRAQTSESSESGVATVPTPSVPSASFRNSSEVQWGPNGQISHSKRMLHKACQTSPRASVEKETLKSVSEKNEQISVDVEKHTIPVLHVTLDSCNNLAEKISDSESSAKSGDCSQLYCEENEYYQTYDAKSLNCDVTIPGAISEPSSVFLIEESNNLQDKHNVEEELTDEKDVEEKQVQNISDVNRTPFIISENKKILEDLSQWISSEHIQYLLKNTTNTQKLKNMLQDKSKSFSETDNHCSVLNQRSYSASGKLLNEEENHAEIMSDSDGVEQRSNYNCLDGTPTPLPPSTGQTESHSSEGDCYMTDCEICAAEGRKCCSLDDSCSQTFSITSPDMNSTNGFKTSSDFTSSSITLDQTVSDRSTSTQDSTLSITSITPESINSKSTSTHFSPLLVINTETFLIQPVESGGRNRDYTFHPSDSTPRTTPSPSKAEDNPQVCKIECDNIPLVISCESALINPIEEKNMSVNYSEINCRNSNGAYVSDELPTKNSQYLQISGSEFEKGEHLIDNNFKNIDDENTKQTVNCPSDKINLNDGFGSNEIIKLDDNQINSDTFKYPTSTLSLEVKNNNDLDDSLEVPVKFEGANFQLNLNTENSSDINLKVKSDDENESKDQPGDDFEMDSLAIEDSGSSEEITVTENTGSFCGTDKLNKAHKHNENVEYFKASNTEDEMSSEDTDLLEKLGFCENIQKNNKYIEQSSDIHNNSETSYDEKCKKQVQDMFYGNRKYELIVKETKQNNNLRFKGNVMTTRDDKSNSVNNSEKVNNYGVSKYDVMDSKECMTEFSILGGGEKQHDNGQCEDIIVLKSDGKTMGSVTGGTYWETPGSELIIPRYSAMPRTLSMLVNTSSMDYSSDSDLSLADSLEDNTITGRVKTSNKHDNRLVRGDVMALLPETGSTTRKHSKESQAYFLSLTGEEGEIKSEPIPDELKKKLLKRDNEIKKHSDHSSKHLTKKQDHKRSKKHRHHSPVKHSTSTRRDKFELSPTFDSVDKSCKSTQWEDIPSSRAESSDTLVPSETSYKDVENLQISSKATTTHLMTQSKEVYNFNEINCKNIRNTSTNTDNEENLQQNDEYNLKFEEIIDEITISRDKSTTTEIVKTEYIDDKEPTCSENLDLKNVKNEETDSTSINPYACNISTNTESINKQTELDEENEEGKTNANNPRKVNKWVQCIDSTFSDTETDKEISKILLEAYVNDQADNEKFEHNIEKLTKDAVTTTNLEKETIPESNLNVENSIDEQILICTKSVQTDSSPLNVCENNNSANGSVKKITFSEMFQQTSQEEDDHLTLLDVPSSEANLLNSISNEKRSVEDVSEENRCKTPVFGEKLIDKPVSTKQAKNGNKPCYNNKQGPRFNVRTTPSRRIGNLSSRFRQRFEVIPEEKNGSMDSSAEEKSLSPQPPPTSRRASIPMNMLLMENKNEKQNSESSTSSDKLDETNNVGSRGTQFENPVESQRRHTIHGNLERRNKTDYNKSFEKNEQHRRHTIHGNLALTSRNTALIKKLNLMGGTVLKGRVFSKRSGVMIGQFRPMNEETQVEKDEKSAVGEQLERLRRGGCKGRQALAVTQNQEHEELLTLSKGWINFYLLKDSQDLGSDGSNGEEGSQNSSLEEKLGRETPAGKTVTVVNKPEENVRQYSVQIHAVPEQHSPETKLPDVKKRPSRSPKTPPQSPDCILPDITPTSSPNSPSPTLTELTKTELPQIQTDKQISKMDKGKQCSHRRGHKKEPRERLCPSPAESERSVEYLKLLSPKQESEKTFLTCSGELACSEHSPSTLTSSTCDSATESPALPTIKWPARHLHRRNHTRFHRTDTTKHSAQASNGAAGQACWTVTLAGSSGYPTAPPPDVEMRLSFPNHSQGAPTSQSDSGLGEDNFQSRCEKRGKRQQALPPSSAKRWSLSIKNPQQAEEKGEAAKVEKRQFQSLPDVSYQPTTARSKKSAKR